MKSGLALGGALAALSLLIVLPQPVAAGVMVYESEDVTMELGLRMQPRATFAKGIATGGLETEWQRDFLVRRSRMKIGGKAMTAKYYLEWALDKTGLNGGAALPTPNLENGYIQFPVSGKQLQIRAGLYDQPYSRDRLTSDSKQLAVDRGSVSNVLSSLGLADNAIGVDARGTVNGGRTSYVIGAYDNRTIASAVQNKMPMVIGRLDFNLGSNKNVYRDAHFGDDSWYSVGVNAGFQGGLKDGAGKAIGSNVVFGGDGMVDVPAGDGRLLVRGEVNLVKRTDFEIDPTKPDDDTTVTAMAGAGYLINGKIQPIVRYDQVILDDLVGGGKMNTTNVGCNYYMRGHNLKVQADITIVSGSGDSVDGGRVQAQLDF